MSGNYATRKRNNERLEIKLPPEHKRMAFELAAKQGMSVGHLVRVALEAFCKGGAA